MKQPLFTLGKILSTGGALELLERFNINLHDLVQRHVSGDFGDLCDEDKQLNRQAIEDGSRILSSYSVSDSDKVWLITEAKNSEGIRVATTALKPSEY